MTKENLRDLFCKQLNSSQHWGDLSIFDEFFESNVCIPKGKSRHQYADALHEWLEDMTLPLEWYNDTYDSKEHHGFVKQSDNLLRINKEYRIKPSEPEYEYQWVYGQRGNSSRSVRLSEHCTKDELFTKFTDDIDVYFYMPVDETKRERR